MTKLLRASIVGCALAVGVGAGTSHAASAQSSPPATFGAHQRGELGSARNIRRIERHIKREIAMLEQDQKDYGGHRVAAIRALQTADQELIAALQTDATTPR